MSDKFVQSFHQTSLAKSLEVREGRTGIAGRLNTDEKMLGSL